MLACGVISISSRRMSCLFISSKGNDPTFSAEDSSTRPSLNKMKEQKNSLFFLQMILKHVYIVHYLVGSHRS